MGKGMTKAEAGRLGGLATKARYGKGYYSRIGKMGGRKGGLKTKSRHGSAHFKRIGRKGGLH